MQSVGITKVIRDVRLREVAVINCSLLFLRVKHCGRDEGCLSSMVPFLPPDWQESTDFKNCGNDCRL